VVAKADIGLRFSGISKTSITSELHKIIVMRRGLFVEFEARF